MRARTEAQAAQIDNKPYKGEAGGGDGVRDSRRGIGGACLWCGGDYRHRHEEVIMEMREGRSGGGVACEWGSKRMVDGHMVVRDGHGKLAID